MGDVELLGRAAAHLDTLLSGTTTGRWQVDRPWVHDRAGRAEQTDLVTAGEGRTAVVLGVPDLGTGRDSGPDLAYVVAMQPPVGRALARWLQAAARESETSPWAVSVAREILGEKWEGGEGWTGPR